MRRPLAFALTLTATALALPTHAQTAGDPDKGKAVFRQCTVCHSVNPDENRVGPSLAGVFGRKAGEAPGFNYSKAVKDSGLTWDENNLSKYLENPQQTIKGTRMAFPGIKNPKDREDIIAYIKTLK